MPRIPRTLLLLFLLTGVAAGGFWAYREPTLRAAARDYLAPRIVMRHEEVIRAAAEESGVDPNLLAAIMFAESSGRVDAVSSKDALGLFQLSQITADWRAEALGLPKPTREELLSDTLLNARLGADNMSWLLDTYGDDELRAACAYNAGYGLLARLTNAAGGWRAWCEQGEASGRSEILAYGKKVLRYRDEFNRRGLFDSE